MPFNVLATAQARPFAHGQVKLVYSSSTQLVLTYGNGDLIKINGVWRRIPSGGVTISNAGLSTNVLYYVYAYWTGSAVALEFSTTARATSTAAGNEGVMAKSGDDSRSLVGMVYTGAGNTFWDQANTRWVRSWFNDDGISGSAYSGTSVSTTNASMTLLDANAYVYMLLWTNEVYDQKIYSWASCSAVGAAQYFQCGVNGGLTGAYDVNSAIAANNYMSMTNGWSAAVGADGVYTFQQFGMTSGGTITFYNKMNVVSTQRR